MADLEKWRAKAQYCTEMAENADQPEATRTWQILAQVWLSMLSVFERGDRDQKATASKH
jgi:hypothetical protein